MFWKQQKQAAMRILWVVALAVAIASLLFLQREKPSAAEAPSAPRSLAPTSGASADIPTPASVHFDPNTADSSTLVDVGLAPWQARSLIRWRRAGKRFSRKEDLKALNGLTVEQWQHIAPLIDIAPRFRLLADVEDVYAGTSAEVRHYAPRRETLQAVDSLQTPSQGEATPPRVPKLAAGQTIDLSECDTSLLKLVPGIGDVRSRLLVEYADRLGGFASLSQLNDPELDFLPLGVEKYMTLQQPNVRPLRINHLGVRELSHHPYISRAQAKAITQRVRVVGPFRSWDELLFLPDFEESDHRRLLPYVSFE